MIERLIQLANDIGLHALGIAPAIDEVREVFPWAGAVIVAAISYLPPEEEHACAMPTGRVARFARSADYHLVLRSKLGIIANELGSNARTEICVDTAPLPERKLAVLAGIAVRGRNGNVFVDGCGSYAALGEIVTDAVLPASQGICFAGSCPEAPSCKNCDRCLKACPTGAITATGVVDASRCVSRLTQMSGVIPRDLRRAMGDRIYGCDTCQEVCPVNTGVRPSSPELAAHVFPGARPELTPLIRLTADEFKAYVKESSIGWIRRTRIRRNAAIAAGNLKCADAVPALIEMLSDPDPMLRIHAAWALGEIGATDTLKQALTSETDPLVIEEIRTALANK